MMLPCVEDGEVGNLHCDALEHQLSDARYHVGNHTLNRSSRKWGVVTCHVIYELVDVVGLSDDRKSPLARMAVPIIIYYLCIRNQTI